MPDHWILQATPDRYNIDGQLSLAPDRTFWTLRQHATDVQPGDVAWLWRASGRRGRTAGLLAQGVVQQPADDVSVIDDFSLDAHDAHPGPVIAIILEGVLPPGETLSREALRQVPGLQDLAVIVRPQGTVFPVTAPQAACLEAQFAQCLAAQTDPPAADPSLQLDWTSLRTWATRCFRSPDFWRHLDKELARRREALPEMSDLVGRFLDGTLDVEAFREEFDRRTRSGAWAAFGFGGMSGGMALNKMVKHLPDLGALEHALRAASRAPGDPAGAVAQIDALEALLEQAIGAGQVTRFQLQPERLPFLLSAIWHVQEPDRWPVRFDTVRQALKRCGLVLEGTMSARYVHLRAGERAARAELGLPAEVLDLICAFTGPLGDEPQPPEPAREPRTWAIGVGHADHDEFWTWFQQGSVIAMGGGIGDLSDYPDRDAMHAALKPLAHTSDNPSRDALACWQFRDEVRPGDRVIARHGRSLVLGVGQIDGRYRHEPESPYENVRDVTWRWTGRLELPGKPLAIQTLVDVTGRTDLLAGIEAELAATEGGAAPPVASYTLEQALKDLFLDRSEVEAHLARLRRRHNLVLQGPPGTGKTFVAARLARLMTGEASDTRVCRVQFHQSYTYEHFVQGFQATPAGGFRLVDGPFKRLCDTAREDAERDYVVLIDEINRGNLGRIFGELLLLIEGDKRSPDWAVELAYSQERFWVPPNVYLVGTMNTADRSLALVDYALRRRFAFTWIAPAWSRTQLRAHLEAQVGVPAFVARMVTAMAQLNQLIGGDDDLGVGFKIGHSWFCQGPRDGLSPSAWWADIVETELEPLLAEYWFDRPDTLDAALALLRWDGE